MMGYARFQDRRDAGRQLADALVHLKNTHPLVLALPRGGVPVGYEVAKMLNAELDVLLVRKIGAPGHEELGIGAVIDGSNPQVVLNDDIISMTRPPPGYIEAETNRQLTEIERRRLMYRGEQVAIPIKGRTVIVVDDGIATGGTVKAALKGVRQNTPARLILAIPVAPADSIAQLSGLCDEIICLSRPDPFYAVGQHYADFTQTADEEVIALLADARRLVRSPPA